jgi:hypothetical protein
VHFDTEGERHAAVQKPPFSYSGALKMLRSKVRYCFFFTFTMYEKVKMSVPFIDRDNKMASVVGTG